VRAFLVERGFPAQRLSVVSYGETRPVADNRTDEGRFRNRRIEFALLP
jgi:outer membrane protein OmpA-like peptidoglycan-associated protein